VCYGLAVAIPVLWTLVYRDAPLVEDALFWFVPAAGVDAARGWALVAQGALPADVLGEHLLVPPQWGAGLPDTGHPPLWYWWLATFLRFGMSLASLRVACLVPAIVGGVGFVALARDQGRAWAGLALWCIPGVLAQVLRPELDLPLLAIVPWALLAVRRRAWGAFTVLALLATWVKEPGVLLFVPAAIQALRDRRGAPGVWAAVFTPVLGLGAWALVDGGLAPLLHTPLTAAELGANVGGVLRYVAFDQGRWCLLLGAAGLFAAPAEAGFVIANVLFFAYVRYDATSGTQDAFTHLRYLGPALAVGVVTASAGFRFPVAVAQLCWLHRVHANGPEASMAGIDGAYTDRAALRQSVAAPVGRIWVGSYLAAGVGRPWAGYPAVDHAAMYTFDTLPTDLRAGDLLLVSPYGEPATRLERALDTETVRVWSLGDVSTQVLRVRGTRPDAWVPAARDVR
jgi:hypothetical protein